MSSKRIHTVFTHMKHEKTHLSIPYTTHWSRNTWYLAYESQAISGYVTICSLAKPSFGGFPWPLRHWCLLSEREGAGWGGVGRSGEGGCLPWSQGCLPAAHQGPVSDVGVTTKRRPLTKCQLSLTSWTEVVNHVKMTRLKLFHYLWVWNGTGHLFAL